MNDLRLNLTHELMERGFKDEALALALDAYDCIIGDYDVSRRETSLVRVHDAVPRVLTYYLENLSLQNRSPATIKMKTYTLKPFLVSCPYDLRDITPDYIRSYMWAYKDSHGLKPASLELLRCTLSAFFKWCLDEGYIAKNPMVNIKAVKLPVRIKPAFKPEEKEALRNACQTNRERFIIEFMLSSGCRIAEFARLKIEDIDWKTHSVKLTGKGDKTRITYVSPEAEFYYKEYMKETRIYYADGKYAVVHSRGCQKIEYVLTNTRTKEGKPIGVASLRHSINRIVERAGISTHGTPHTFRRTFATNLARKNVDTLTLQRLLGHNDISTTQRYIDTSIIDIDINRVAAIA